MATIKDIAKETGLGIGTISKYINGGKVRQNNQIAIEAAIDKLGFTINEFARGLKTSRSRTVGIVIPEFSHVFHTSIVTVVEDELRKSGYGVITCDCRSDRERECEAVRFLMGKRVDGIISMPMGGRGEHLKYALDATIPIVLVDRMIPELKDKVSAVLVDNVSASVTAVQTLFDAGHRNIGIILGPQDIFTSQQRLLGYYQVLIQNSLQPNESRIIFSDYTLQGGYESMKRLLKDPGLTAVFVTNYDMTLGAIIAVNESGVHIPEQLSFIGFDNMQLSEIVRPKPTIITQPIDLIGQKAAEIMLERVLDDEKTLSPCVVTLPTGIVPGDSIKRL